MRVGDYAGDTKFPYAMKLGPPKDLGINVHLGIIGLFTIHPVIIH